MVAEADAADPAIVLVYTLTLAEEREETIMEADAGEIVNVEFPLSVELPTSVEYPLSFE